MFFRQSSRAARALAAFLAALVPLGALTGVAAATGAMAVALAGTAAAGAPAATRQKAGRPPFVAGSFTLANGLRGVVIVNRRAPVALHMVWYRAGAIDEPAGKSGIAHFVEHLLFKGTKTRKSGEFSRIVAANGGRENAFTSWDYTGYFQFVAADRLERMMEIEADRMANLALAPDEVAQERRVILEERRSRVDSRPSAILWEQARRALYLNHRYGRPIIGWMHEMERLSRADALEFYRRHYGPDNAVLVVAGDVDPAEVRRLAERHYGPVKRIGLPPGPALQEPPQRAERRVIYRDRRVHRPAFGRLYLAPGYNGAGAEHAYALQVLSRILGSSSTSLLYQSLVVRQKLATTAGSDYGASRRGPSDFYIYASPRRGIGLERLEKAVDAELAKILKNGVPATAVEAAKQQLQDMAVYARDSLRYSARAVATALITGRTVQDVEAWPERIGAVTAEQVAAAARHVLQRRRSVTALLLPAETPDANAAKNGAGKAGKAGQ